MEHLLKYTNYPNGIAWYALGGLIIGYIILAISLNRLMKQKGHPELAGIAYVPIFNVYLFGILAGDLSISENLKLKKETVGALILTVSFVRTFINIGLIASLPLAAFGMFVVYHVLKNLGAPDGHVFVFTLISAVFPLFFLLYLYQMSRRIEYN